MQEYLKIQEFSNENDEKSKTLTFYSEKMKIGEIEVKNNSSHKTFISELNEISEVVDHGYYSVKKDIFVKLLCENGKINIIRNIGNLDFNYENMNGETPLLSALIPNSSNKDLIYYLLERKSNVNYVNKYNESCLMYLIRTDPRNNKTIPDKIELLLENGADLNLITINGTTIYEEMIEHQFFYFRTNIFNNPRILNYLPQDNLFHFITKLKKSLMNEITQTSDPFVLNFYKFIRNKFELINYDSDNILKGKIKKFMRKITHFSDNTLSIIINYIFFI